MIRLIALLAWLAVCTPALASGERILDYHSDIRIQADASIEVTEHIRVRSQQRSIRRGIYRDFPTRYRDRLGNRVVVEFEVLEVLRDGQPEPWFTERRSNGVRLNTGDDNFLPGPGEYTFSIRYRTERQLGFFDAHDELYWNVTGLGWAFPIDRASAAIHLPAAVAAAEIQLDSYTGPAGATTSHAHSQVTAPGQVRFETTQVLNSGEGLTIAVGFPKGLVSEPSTTRRLGWLLYDNRGLLLMLAGLILALLYYIQAWHRHGRDPAPGVIIARYQPPDGYGPSGVRFLMRRSYDQRCFSADLVDLAVHGLLRIDRTKNGRKDDWTLIRTAAAASDAITPAQDVLFSKLFAKGGELPLKSSESARVVAAMTAHNRALTKRYHGHYLQTNHGILAIGWLGSALIAALAFMIGGGDALIGTISLGAVLLIVNVIFIFLLPRPTAAGRQLLDQIEGLKLYLSVAERDELKRLEHAGEDEPELNPQRYEALLPYALALEVEQAWTDKFTQAVGESLAEQTSNNLGWYTGSGAALGGLGAMSQSLGKSLSTSISSSANPPGSGSGGGGGGFSGGGGGGGGGGGR